MAARHAHCWGGIALLLCAFAGGGAAFARQASLPANLLVRSCQTLYNSDWGTDSGKWAKEAKAAREQAAGRVFGSMPQAALRRRLTPLLARLKPGTDAYTSVAYVLAYRGIEVVPNLQRMALAATEAGAEDADAWLNLPAKLGKVYRVHPSEAALRVVLRVHGDGEVAEELASVRGGLFLAHPRAVLRAASQDSKMLALLADDLAYETVGDDADTRAKHIRRALRLLCHNPALSHAARTCLARIGRAERQERQFPH